MRLVRLALAELARQQLYPSIKMIYETTQRLDEPDHYGVRPDAYKQRRNLTVYGMILAARGRKSPVPTPSFELLEHRSVKPGRDLQRVFARYQTQFTKRQLAQRLIAFEEENVRLRARQTKLDQESIGLQPAAERLAILQQQIDHYSDFLQNIQEFAAKAEGKK